MSSGSSSTRYTDNGDWRTYDDGRQEYRGRDGYWRDWNTKQEGYDKDLGNGYYQRDNMSTRERSYYRDSNSGGK